MSQPNKNEKVPEQHGGAQRADFENFVSDAKRNDIRYDFEDFDVTFHHDDSSNEDFSEVIIEGRGKRHSPEGEYLENVVLASGVQILQSERFREKTRSIRAAEKALKELDDQSRESLTAHSEIPAQNNAENAEQSQPSTEGTSVQVQKGVEPSKSKREPFQIDERDENSDKRHHVYKKHSNAKIARQWRKMKKWQRAIIIILLLLLALVLAAGITVYSMYNSGKKEMLNGNYGETFENIITVDGVEYMYNTDITSIAFFGIDKRAFGVQDELVSKVGQNDVNMVIAINIKTGESNVILLPRDTLVDVNKYSLDGDYMGTAAQQLCLAYAYGDGESTSCDNAIASVQRLLYGVPINTYVALNLDGIKPLNDMLGGVTLICPNDFGDMYKKGEEITLQGDEAERFIRNREHTLYGDAERRERQIAYVKAYVSQAAKMALKNPNALTDFYNVGKDYTVTNLTLSRGMYFSSAIMSNVSEVISFENVYSLKGKLQTDEAGYAVTVLDEESTKKTVLDVYYTALK